MGVREYPEEPELAALSAEEVALIREQINTIIKEVSPAVKAIIEWGFDAIIQIVRRVKKNVKKPFVGALARGEQLTIMFGVPHYFTKAGTTITSWLFTAAVGYDWFISGSGDAAIDVPEEEGLVFLAFANPIDVPRSTVIQLEKGGDLFVPTNLLWELTEKIPIIRLKSPWIIEPKQNYRVRIRYNTAGDDNTQPISFRVCRAKDILPSP